MEGLIARVRAWLNTPVNARYMPVFNTGDAVADGGGYANTGVVIKGTNTGTVRASGGKVLINGEEWASPRDVLREVLAELAASETGNPGLTYDDAVAAVRHVATRRGVVL